MEIKNAFDMLISTLEMAEERVSELEDISIETDQIKKNNEKKTEKTRTQYPVTTKQLQRL